MIPTLKQRFIRYMVAQYKQLTEKEIDQKIESAIDRVADNTEYSKDVLTEVKEQMLEEGYAKARILAHLNIIDIAERT